MPKGYYEYLILDDDPKWLRIIPGMHETEIYKAETDEIVTVTLPFFRYLRHYDPGIKRMIPCSAGDEPDFAAKPCIGCSKGLHPQETYVYTVVHLADYHLVPWVKDNQVQMNNKTGKAIMNYELCEGNNCKMCRSDVEKVFGRKLHMSLSYTQNNYLRQKADDLKGYCKCGEQIDLCRLHCPQCSRVLVDIDDTDKTDKEIREVRKNGMMCPTCKRNMQLLDEYDCECGDPRPVSIFDVDVSLANVKVAEKKYNLEVAFNKPGPIDPKYTGNVEPHEFKDIFSPPNIESQKMIYKYQGPVTNASEEEATEKY